jgi:DNA-binding XRE family transcriptional regulator
MAAASKDDAVHNRLRQIRIERGISRRDFADAVGIHYQTVGYLERGEYSPSLPMALKIVSYFELPLESVFSLSPFPKVGETD